MMKKCTEYGEKWRVVDCFSLPRLQSVSWISKEWREFYLLQSSIPEYKKSKKRPIEASLWACAPLEKTWGWGVSAEHQNIKIPQWTRILSFQYTVAETPTERIRLTGLLFKKRLRYRCSRTGNNILHCRSQLYYKFSIKRVGRGIINRYSRGYPGGGDCISPRGCCRRLSGNGRVNVSDDDWNRVVFVAVNLEGAELLREIPQGWGLDLPEAEGRVSRMNLRRNRVHVAVSGNPHDQIRIVLELGKQGCITDNRGSSIKGSRNKNPPPEGVVLS